MLKNILTEAALHRGFDLIAAHETCSFFMLKNGDAERYLVVKELIELKTIDAIHEEVLSELPENLKQEPAFDKNCDLVLYYKFTHFSEYRSLESHILSYEEDPYHFKKYFLYYITAEESLLNGKTYQDCLNALPNTLEFATYKTDPFRPSFYSISARIFIKLPFLNVPRVFHELLPLEKEVEQAIAEKNLTSLFEQLTSSGDLNNSPEIMDQLIEKLLNEELENL